MALKNIAISSHGLNLFDEAIGFNRQAIELSKQQDDTSLIGEIYRNLAKIYNDLVMIDKVEATYLEAILYFEKTLPNTEYEWLSARDDLADFYYKNDKYEDSLVISYNILNYYDENLGGPQPHGCHNFNRLGLLETHFENYDLAEKVFLKMLEMHSEYESECFAAGYGNLASLYEKQNKIDQAEEMYLKAIEIEEKSGSQDFEAYFHYADLLFYDEERYIEAGPLFLKALELSENNLNSSPEFRLSILARIIEYYYELNDHKLSYKYLNETNNLLNELALNWESQNNSRLLPYKFRWISELIAETSFWLTDFEEFEHQMETLIDISFKAAQLSNISSAQVATRNLGLRNSVSNSEKVNIFLELEELKEKLKEKNILINEYILSSDTDSDTLSNLTYEQIEISNNIDNLEEKISTSISEVREINNPISISEIYTELNFDEAFLLITPTYFEDMHLVYIIDVDGFVAFSVNMSKTEVGNLSNSIRKSLTVSENGSLNSFDFNASYALYDGIFKEAIAYIEDVSPYIKSIKYSTFGPLQSIPLGLLTTSKKNQNFLIDKYDFALLPSANSLRHLKKPEITSKSNFVGFGNSNFTGQRFASTRGITLLDNSNLGLHSKIKKFSPLPDTEKEILSISSLFDGDRNSIYLGRNSNEKKFKEISYKDVDVVAIATHGVQSESFLNLDESALLLPFNANEKLSNYDGAVLASEIQDMNFDAEIVLLSACNTAYGDKNYSEILSGLTSSFFNAGAKSLLVSNWAIDSKTTTDFTSRVFKNLINQKTLSPSKALRNAMISTRKEGYKHPFYWASLTYAGR